MCSVGITYTGPGDESMGCQRMSSTAEERTPVSHVARSMDEIDVQSYTYNSQRI